MQTKNKIARINKIIIQLLVALGVFYSAFNQVDIANVHALGIGQINAASPPATPSNLQATALSNTEVLLTWIDNSNDEAGFVIYEDGHFIATAGSDVQSITIGNLAPNSSHCYFVYAYNGNGNSDWSNQACVTLDSSSPPGAAILVSPSGVITDNNPTYKWNRVIAATWYYLYVDDPSGRMIFQKWYESSTVCGDNTCSVSPELTLSGGEYRWRMVTWNAAGYGPWSSIISFSVQTIPPPGAATLVSPSAAIIDTTPTYTWNKVDAATWYYLYVDDSSGTPIIQQWYEASTVCNSSTCSVTLDVALSNGNFSWWILTWNLGGYGPWSSIMSFSVGTAGLPGAATLVSPSGAITDNNPTYIWNKVDASTWYNFRLSNADSGTIIIERWYPSSTVCGNTMCSLPLGLPLGSGNYTWSIQTWNDNGYGSWSSIISFSVGTTSLPAATLISPSGAITDNNPTYVWNKVDASTWYFFRLSNADMGSTVIERWYPSSAVCGSTTCSLPLGLPLNSGNYAWSIQTWNDNGYGPWSSAMSFSLP